MFTKEKAEAVKMAIQTITEIPAVEKYLQIELENARIQRDMLKEVGVTLTSLNKAATTLTDAFTWKMEKELKKDEALGELDLEISKLRKEIEIENLKKELSTLRGERRVVAIIPMGKDGCGCSCKKSEGTFYTEENAPIVEKGKEE